MAHSASAEKRNRQNIKRRLRNRRTKTELKILTKKFLGLLTLKKKDEAQKALRELSGNFDKAAKKGIIHKNNASRHKSRLTQRFSKAFA